MRIKMKIAYHAKCKQMSITEFLVTGVIKTFRLLRQEELKRDGLWDDFDYCELDASDDTIGGKIKK
jgi:hypothetical protein